MAAAEGTSPGARRPRRVRALRPVPARAIRPSSCPWRPAVLVKVSREGVREGAREGATGIAKKGSQAVSVKAAERVGKESKRMGAEGKGVARCAARDCLASVRGQRRPNDRTSGDAHGRGLNLRRERWQQWPLKATALS